MSAESLVCSLCCVQSRNVKLVEELDAGPGLAKWVSAICPGCQRHIARKPGRPRGSQAVGNKCSAG